MRAPTVFSRHAGRDPGVSRQSAQVGRVKPAHDEQGWSRSEWISRNRSPARASRLAEGGDPVDAADEEDALLVDRGIAQPVGPRLLRILGPDAVELARHVLAARLPLAQLLLDGAFDLHPMIGVV